MAQYKFNQAEYDKWLKSKYGNAIPTAPQDVQQARLSFIQEVLAPMAGGNQRMFNDAVREFRAAKEISPEFDETIIQIAANLPVLKDTTISPSSPANNQGTTPPTPKVGGGKAIVTPTESPEDIIKRFRSGQSLTKAVEGVEKAQAQKIAGGVAAGTGALKALTGLGQYLGGRKALRDLERPEAPVYQTNQNIDTELARLQVLAQSGDPIIRERAMRDIATRQAVAEQAARVGSAGDVSTFASGVAGANIAGMNAARELAGDENQRKIQYSAALQSLIGQQTADRQYKNQADMANFQNDYAEFVRQGNRAAGQMNAGVSNIATGVQDLSLGGANFAGKDAAMNKLLMDFEKMTPEQQAEMVKRYPKLFKMPTAPSISANAGFGSRVLPSAIAALGTPYLNTLTDFTIPK